MKRVLISFILSVTLLIGLASATTVYLEPGDIKGVGVGDTFDVKINVRDVENLYAYELKLAYDTDILDVDSIVRSNFLNQPTNEIKKMIDEDNGFLWYAETSVNPAEPKSGLGTLAKVTFKVTGSGKSSLSLYDTALTNVDVELIEHSVGNSMVSTGSSISSQTIGLFLILILLVVIAFFISKHKKPRKKSKK